METITIKYPTHLKPLFDEFIELKGQLKLGLINTVKAISQRALATMAEKLAEDPTESNDEAVSHMLECRDSKVKELIVTVNFS